jgi:hypothetical protein
MSDQNFGRSSVVVFDDVVVDIVDVVVVVVVVDHVRSI